MARSDPAAAVWAALVAAALAADVVLVRAGRPSLSDCAARTVARRAAVVYLAAHLLVRSAHLRRIDPLSRAADRLRRV